jgi:hypothetical protein
MTTAKVKVPSALPLASSLWRVMALVIVFAVTAGCALRLAPQYDPSIVRGIESANEQAMVLFATVAPGVKASTFPTRAPAYAQVIGQLDALRLLAESRPAPPPPSFGPSAGQVVDPPTPSILTNVSALIAQMRDRDARHGLTAAQVPGFRQSYETWMEQAITYETALRR